MSESTSKVYRAYWAFHGEFNQSDFETPEALREFVNGILDDIEKGLFLGADLVEGDKRTPFATTQREPFLPSLGTL